MTDRAALSGPEAAERLSALFGPVGWRGPLALALDYSAPPRMSEALKADRAPRPVVLTLEWLETVPPSRWPARYAELRALHKQHRKEPAT